jgi:hypothetical protein
MKVELSHIITIVVVMLGYLSVSLIAWGRLTSQVSSMKETLKETVNRSDLVAAVESMKSEMYKALSRDRRGADRSEP